MSRELKENLVEEKGVSTPEINISNIEEGINREGKGLFKDTPEDKIKREITDEEINTEKEIKKTNKQAEEEATNLVKEISQKNLSERGKTLLDKIKSKIEKELKKLSPKIRRKAEIAAIVLLSTLTAAGAAHPEGYPEEKKIDEIAMISIEDTTGIESTEKLELETSERKLIDTLLESVVKDIQNNNQEDLEYDMALLESSIKSYNSEHKDNQITMRGLMAYQSEEVRREMFNYLKKGLVKDIDTAAERFRKGIQNGSLKRGDKGNIVRLLKIISQEARKGNWQKVGSLWEKKADYYPYPGLGQKAFDDYDEILDPLGIRIDLVLATASQEVASIQPNN